MTGGGDWRVVAPSPADAAAVAVLWRLSIERLCGADHHGDPAIIAAWTANKTADGLAAAFADPALCWRLAVAADGTVAGVGLLGPDAIVRAVYVHPEWTGRGVGSLILQVLEDVARTQGHPSLRLESTATGRAFYRRRGFREAAPAVTRFGVVAYPMEKAVPADGRPAAKG